ncbi:hypothetical protein [Streptomyces sp. MP131-18]|uniref:hypothetical protein n=1 Tax=Streptomyces sp. MP131-18 TaxID=1857892 RepID=UPI00117D0936|nr:hypothetical protein [Streptomyces sp. MP131-18]
MQPALFAAQRPLVRWGVLRRARVAAEAGRLVVRGRARTHAWPLGPQGVASAVHLKGRPCSSAARTRLRDLGKGAINKSGGCVHLCDSTGRALACLLPSDWLPNGAVPVPLDAPDTFPSVRNDSRREDFLELSGMADFLRHQGLAVHESPGQEPPRAPEFAGTLRPGPKDGPAVLLLFFALAQLLVLMLAAFAVGGFGSGEGAWQLLVSLPFLVFALCTAGAAFLLGLAAPRGEEPAVAELRPSPGVPVTRGFLGRSSLRLVADALELRTAQNVKRRLPPPADPVLGVREAVVLQDGGRPWGVALVDRRRAVLAFLHGDTWFGGDPQLTRLTDFCHRAGIGLRRQELRAFPGRQEADRTARPWRTGDYALNDTFAYSALMASVVAVGVVPAFFVGAGGDVEGPLFLVIFGLAFAIGAVPYAVRGAVRKWSLNRLVPAGPAPNMEPGGAASGGKGAATP